MRYKCWLTLAVHAHVQARQLHIAPETMSRQLRRFTQAALIGGQRREWVLIDVEGLCRIVNLPGMQRSGDDRRQHVRLPPLQMGSELQRGPHRKTLERIAPPA